MVKNSDCTPILEKMKEQLPRIKEKVAKATQRYERKQHHIDYRYRYTKRNVVTWKSDRNILWKKWTGNSGKVSNWKCKIEETDYKIFPTGIQLDEYCLVDGKKLVEEKEVVNTLDGSRNIYLKKHYVMNINENSRTFCPNDVTRVGQ